MACVSACASVWISLCVCGFTCLCMCLMSVRVRVRVCACVCKCVCVCCVRKYVCINVWICNCVYVCAWMCVDVCGCLSRHQRQRSLVSHVVLRLTGQSSGRCHCVQSRARLPPEPKCKIGVVTVEINKSFYACDGKVQMKNGVVTV